MSGQATIPLYTENLNYADCVEIWKRYMVLWYGEKSSLEVFLHSESSHRFPIHVLLHALKKRVNTDGPYLYTLRQMASSPHYQPYDALSVLAEIFASCWFHHHNSYGQDYVARIVNVFSVQCGFSDNIQKIVYEFVFRYICGIEGFQIKVCLFQKDSGQHTTLILDVLVGDDVSVVHKKICSSMGHGFKKLILTFNGTEIHKLYEHTLVQLGITHGASIQAIPLSTMGSSNITVNVVVEKVPEILRRSGKSLLERQQLSVNLQHTDTIFQAKQKITKQYLAMMQVSIDAVKRKIAGQQLFVVDEKTSVCNEDALCDDALVYDSNIVNGSTLYNKYIVKFSGEKQDFILRPMMKR